jgi:hypothetical protein
MDSSGNSATAKKIHIKDVCSHVMHVTELREWRKNCVTAAAEARGASSAVYLLLE